LDVGARRQFVSVDEKGYVICSDIYSGIEGETERQREGGRQRGRGRERKGERDRERER